MSSKCILYNFWNNIHNIMSTRRLIKIEVVKVSCRLYLYVHVAEGFFSCFLALFHFFTFLLFLYQRNKKHHLLLLKQMLIPCAIILELLTVLNSQYARSWIAPCCLHSTANALCAFICKQLVGKHRIISEQWFVTWLNRYVLKYL
jgi:hypothetical protein